MGRLPAQSTKGSSPVWELETSGKAHTTSLRGLSKGKEEEMRIRNLLISALIGALTVTACDQGTPDVDTDTVTTPTVGTTPTTDLGTTPTTDLGTTTTN